MNSKASEKIWFSTCSLYLALVSRTVPIVRRQEWTAEWMGELWQLLQKRHNKTNGKSVGLFSFLLGAFKHAAWERRSFRQATDQTTETIGNAHSRNRIRSALAIAGLDIQQAVRQVLKRPTFALVVCSTLALGIGANTALFSVLYGVLLRPLPYPEAEEVVTIWWQNTDLGWTHNALTAADFVDLQTQNETFESIGVMQPASTTLLGDSDPQRVVAHVVTSEVLKLTAVPPLLGRIFLPEDDVPGSARVTVLSHDLWKNAFAADSNVIGQPLSLSWGNFTVVGVLPREFRWPFGSEPQLWIPMQLDEERRSNRRNHFLFGVGRLRDGIELDQAQADLNTIAGNLEEAYPETNSATGVTVETIATTTVGDVRLTLWLILGAAGVILLIACANVASLFLSQCLGRRREIAVRASLGASRARQISQLLTESIVLAALGGLAGLLLANVGVQLFLALEPGNMPRTDGITTNAPVLLFCFGSSVLASVFFGVVPSLMATKTDVTTSLKDATQSTSQRSSSMRVKNALAIVQMATAIILLVGAGLLGRSFARLLQVNPGFDTENVLLARIPQDGAAYHDGVDRVRFQEVLLERLRLDPIVVSAAAVTYPPFSLTPQWTIYVGGESEEIQQQAVSRITASPAYFDALGLSLLTGRLLNEQDRDGTPRVAVISEETVRRHWPDQNPVGQQFHLGRADSPPLEIVGVVSDIRQYGLQNRPFPAVFLPYAQVPAGDYFVVLKTRTEPMTAVTNLRAVVEELDQELAIHHVQTMEDRVAGEAANPRFLMLLALSFAIVAVVLAATGVYGVLAYTVTQRTHEIGIRLALGASRDRVLRVILQQGLMLVAVATIVGLPLAYGLSRLMQSLLYEIGPADPVTFAAIILIVLGVSLIACYLPAARAARSDPLKALRIE